MTCHKPNSDNRVTIDLSWPLENSVNDGIDKNSYIGTKFSLNFTCLDHPYKRDISRAFSHVRIDLLDYDLLSLSQQEAFSGHLFAFWDKTWQSIFSEAQQHYVSYCIIRGMKLSTTSMLLFDLASWKLRKNCMDVCTKFFKILALPSARKSWFPLIPKPSVSGS